MIGDLLLNIFDFPLSYIYAYYIYIFMHLQIFPQKVLTTSLQGVILIVVNH